MAAYTIAQRDALQEAIAIGATKVRYRDREVTYRSLAEMKSLLREMNLEIMEADGCSPPARPRAVRFVTSKGLF